MTQALDRIEAEFFDGRSARPVPVTVHLEAGDLCISGRDHEARYPIDRLRWPPASRSGSRILALPDGASLHARDPQAFERLAARRGIAPPRVLRWQRSPLGIALAAVALLAIAATTWVWGIPMAARGVVTVMPPSVDEAVGRQALAQFADVLVAESRLEPAQQARIHDAWAGALARAWPDGDAPAHRLLIHRSKVGPNAFALPGGTIVMTDELIQLADGQADRVVGVLAHELGHVAGRHGMRQLVQSSLTATVVALALGDVSSIATSASVLLGNLAYTRDLEREADDAAIRLLQAAGIDPSVMVGFFEKIQALEMPDSDGLGLLFSTHPGPAERIERFRNAPVPAN